MLVDRLIAADWTVDHAVVAQFAQFRGLLDHFSVPVRSAPAKPVGAAVFANRLHHFLACAQLLAPAFLSKRIGRTPPMMPARKAA